MNWSDEHYVKLYTRDTLTWRCWGWEARTLFLHLVRKVNGSGFIETGTMSPAKALTIQLELPEEVVDVGLAQLVSSGTAELIDRAVLLVKYVEAQEAKKSEAQKKRDFREREVARRRSAQPIEPTTPPVHQAEPVGTKLDPPSPAQPSSSPSPTQKKKIAPPEDSGAGFFRWAQDLRLKAGLLEEREPNPAALATWFTKAMLEVNGDRRRLEDAYDKFTDNKHWSTADPPWPFQAFMRQWSDFAPRKAS